ncbi:serine/arginine repetitive matrix protein 1-like, partial [Varroa jacobsoni]|uniref:serine/arginine repetitive matrix protein 1-like n=1 Tax=Varroa jacobsoni TaxID=62625 RepID=UPI000BF7B083
MPSWSGRRSRKGSRLSGGSGSVSSALQSLMPEECKTTETTTVRKKEEVIIECDNPEYIKLLAKELEPIFQKDNDQRISAVISTRTSHSPSKESRTSKRMPSKKRSVKPRSRLPTRRLAYQDSESRSDRRIRKVPKRERKISNLLGGLVGRIRSIGKRGPRNEFENWSLQSKSPQTSRLSWKHKPGSSEFPSDTRKHGSSKQPYRRRFRPKLDDRLKQRRSRALTKPSISKRLSSLHKPNKPPKKSTRPFEKQFSERSSRKSKRPRLSLFSARSKPEKYRQSRSSGKSTFKKSNLSKQSRFTGSPSPDKSRHSPDKSRHSPDKSRHSPDKSRHSPDKSRHSPDRSRHSPDRSRHSPDRSRHSPDRSRHSPDRSRHSPDRSRHS